MCVGGGRRNLRGRYEAMGEERPEGRDTKKATLLKPPSLSICEILHFGAHFQAREKNKIKQTCGIGALQGLPCLNSLSQTAGPLWTVGPSGL